MCEQCWRWRDSSVTVWDSPRRSGSRVRSLMCSRPLLTLKHVTVVHCIDYCSHLCGSVASGVPTTDGRYTTVLRPSTKTSQTSRIVVRLSLGMGRERSRFTVSHIRYSLLPRRARTPAERRPRRVELPVLRSCRLTLARCADPDEGRQAAEACSDRIPMSSR